MQLELHTAAAAGRQPPLPLRLPASPHTATMAAQPPAPPADLVSALQEQLGRVNAMLFNYIGALQRDAPPSAVKGEPLAAQPKAYDVQVRGGEWCCCGF